MSIPASVTRFCACLLVAGLVAVDGAKPMAADCLGYDPQLFLDLHPLVFRGRVVAVTPVGPTRLDVLMRDVLVTFEVDEVLKGTTPARVQMRYSFNLECFLRPFVRDGTYLVYATLPERIDFAVRQPGLTVARQFGLLVGILLVFGCALSLRYRASRRKYAGDGAARGW